MFLRLSAMDCRSQSDWDVFAAVISLWCHRKAHGEDELVDKCKRREIELLDTFTRSVHLHMTAVPEWCYQCEMWTSLNHRCESFNSRDRFLEICFWHLSWHPEIHLYGTHSHAELISRLCQSYHKQFGQDGFFSSMHRRKKTRAKKRSSR